MSDIQCVNAVIDAALADAQRNYQRRLVVLSGTRPWSVEVVRQLLARQDFVNGIWVGDTAPLALPSVAAAKARTILGRNLDLVVYDLWDGLHLDGLASVAGSVVGGGLLILCAPPLEQWRQFADPDYRRLLVHPFTAGDIEGRFLRHFILTLQADADVRLIREGESARLPAAVSRPSRHSPEVLSRPVATDDQRRAVGDIVHVLEGHSRRPLVMTSDRGRGKSSALGIASARLMQGGCRQLVITAPQLAAVQPVFYHAANGLGLEPPAPRATVLAFGDACLRFIPPDDLLRHPVDTDLLMVDEAAAIPAPLLEAMARRYNRVVFSTTVHGYEGTGRGFDIRFKSTLYQLANQVREIHLSQPIRWAQNDPLERWLFNALLLDAKPAAIEPATNDIAQHCVIESIDRDRLLLETDTLKELFGLLILAHYQTTPTDLRNLLDGPNVSIWLVRYQGRVAAVALIAEEGGFDDTLARAIWRGERRPRGHLLPQTLAAHAGFQSAPLLKYWRIMRIAVHPQYQRHGLGRQLLHSIIHSAREQKADLLGSSFAATADVLAFWRGVQCVPVRLGITRDASSGCHSAIVLSAFSDRGGELLEQARARFAEQFPRDLENTFADLDSELVVELLRDMPVFSGYLPEQQDWLDAESYVDGARQLADCRLAIWKLLLKGLSDDLVCQKLNTHQLSLIIKAVLQYQSDVAVCNSEKLTGKKALQASLKAICHILREEILSQK